ncbi:hypothetical protein ACFX2I_030703 [Malus domestica]
MFELSTVNDKNYFIGRFVTGLPSFSKTKNSENKWSLHKDGLQGRQLSDAMRTKRKSPIGSISMVESFDACPHEESEAHEEDDIDSGRRRRTLLLQLMARSPLAS